MCNILHLFHTNVISNSDVTSKIKNRCNNIYSRNSTTSIVLVTLVIQHTFSTPSFSVSTKTKALTVVLYPFNGIVIIYNITVTLKVFSF